jgi:membrane protease YdiL (CAAX protease family)
VERDPELERLAADAEIAVAVNLRVPLLFGPDGLRAKWRVLLFVLGMVLLLEALLQPVNWLASRGLLGGDHAWDTAVQWAAFIAALLPALIASRLERRSMGAYGLPWRSTFGIRFWEGAAWGLGGATLLMGLLYASRSVSFVRVPLGEETLRFAAVSAVLMLGVALFEEFSIRGYLQFTVGRSIGFWHAAVLLSFMFAVEDLLSPGRRDVLRFASSIAFGLLFCLTLLRTGSLWFAVGLHAAFGWAMVFLYGMATPLSPPRPDGAVLHPLVEGPDWLTGGKYGTDGSVLALVVIALLALGVHLRFAPALERG